MKKALLLILIWAPAIYLLGMFSRIYNADVYFMESTTYLNKSDFEMAKKLMDTAILLNPNEPNYFRAQAKNDIVTMAYENLSSQKSLKDEALLSLIKAYELNPNNLVTIRNEVPLYYYLAVKDVRLPGTLENVDGAYLPVVKDFIEKNKARFVDDAGLVALAAKYEKKLGLTKEYGDSVNIVKALRPDLLQWYESFQ